MTDSSFPRTIVIGLDSFDLRLLDRDFDIHIRGLFDKDRHEPPLRHLRHYLPPVEWVKEAWRED